ncbi:hypothetical protein ACJMK2_023087 [Sinanodonta woodiana]|uniref:C2H2-type domain-containing protein n=1 Tax=Sinanodonta woodiana TaxID=1069815 RepID=A0ABD3T357_SINWO
MSIFTCISCRVAFLDAETQRNHYKTDWHRYNLKRKVAELPPVTAETFRERVLTAQREQLEAEEDQSTSCTLCSKHFSTRNAYQNHINSKKHRDAESRQLEKSHQEVNELNKKNTEKVIIDPVNLSMKPQMKEANEVLEEGSSQQPSTVQTRKQTEESTEAKDTKVTGESDSESVESWEGEALGIEECLFCSYVSKTLEDNVKHMTTKHSFFLPDAEYIVDLEGLISYLGAKVGEGNMCLWCNERGKAFHSTKSAQQHMLDKGHCKMLHEGDTILEYADFYDYRSSYPEEESEGATGGTTQEEDMEVESEVTSEVIEGYELVLPSGSVIGHRSLQRYYRQNLPQREYPKTRSILPRMLAQYKALGWTGATGEIAQRRVKDLATVQRWKNRHFTRLGVKANLLQKHFRHQNPK